MSDSPQKNIDENAPALLRLTALWALSEAALGGMMHLFRSPFTGVFVGGSAVVLIAMIASVAKKPGKAILKALLIVLIIKGLVSPHSPITAYFAVAFQGLLGAVLFQYAPSFRLSALLLGVLALTESALQKLLTLTLLFGVSFWDALNEFAQYIGEKLDWTHQSLDGKTGFYLAAGFVGFYAFCGLLIGWLAGTLPKAVERELKNIQKPNIAALNESIEKRKKSFWARPIVRLGLLAVLLFGGVYFFVPNAQKSLSPLWIFLRTTVVLVLWFLIISPILLRILQRFLKKKATKYQAEVQEALGLLPLFRALVRQAWQETKHLPALRRWKALIVRIIAYCLWKG